MKGKELKEWASGLDDDAVILVKERSSYRFEDEFTMKAALIKELPSGKEEVPDADL